MLWRIVRDADASYKRIHAPSTMRRMLIAVRGDICDAFLTNQQEYARFVALSAGSACRPGAGRWSLRRGGRQVWSVLAARCHRCVLWRGCPARMLRRLPTLRASGSRAALRCSGCSLRSGLPSSVALLWPSRPRRIIVDRRWGIASGRTLYEGRQRPWGQAFRRMGLTRMRNSSQTVDTRPRGGLTCSSWREHRRWYVRAASLRPIQKQAGLPVTLFETQALGRCE